ncbi:MAG TPA: alpha/beta fold hydrolase [Patescibacteria group bacterium]
MSSRFSYIYLLMGLTILVIAGVTWGLWNQQRPAPLTIESLSQIENPLSASSQPAATPFQEMTIPYLRSRTYQSSLGEMELLSQNGTYRSYLSSYTSDGLRINGLLTVPTGEQPVAGWPAIVFIHGYIPPTQYRTTEKYVEYVNYLARNGFVVFKIDLRGHGASEGEPGGAYYSSDYVIDTLNAQAALAGSSFVDDSKIGLWGHSMAGNVTLRSLAAKPDIPAAVIWAGAGFSYEDLQEFGISDNSYRPPSQNTERQRRRRELFDTHGEFDPQHPFWRQVIPTNYLSDFGGAIQLHHAVNDATVNVEYSRNLDQLLGQLNIVHQYHEYQSGGHDIEGASFNQAMQATVDFFQEHL